MNDFRNNKSSLTLLILGQSNAANYCSKLFTSNKNIYTFYNNEVYLAKDPLPGASGKKGSIWIPFSESIIEDSIFNKVLLISIAEGSSTVFDWSAKGKYNKKLIKILNQLSKNKIIPDYIFWQQGEQDNLLKTPKDEYKFHFQEILNTFQSYKIESPIFFSLTSYHPLAQSPISYEIRKAQIEIIESNEKVHLGPDTDKYIAKGYRYDGIHFSEKGIQKLIKDWKKAILKKVKTD